MRVYIPEILGIPLITIIQLLALLFIIITFLQAGLDKATDFKGNKAYFTGHFEKTVLAKQAGMLMPVIMIMELSTGLLALAGAVCLFYDKPQIGLYSLLLAMLTLLCLFFGQRVGKFYGEAAGIVPYMIMVFASIIVFAG